MLKNENIVFDSLENFANYFSGISNILIVGGQGEESQYSQKIYSTIKDKNKETKVNLLEVASGEASKDIKTIENIWDTFQKFKIDKASLIVCVGGGALSDSVGFASANYMRGIPFISVPTTLVAMIDASLGGKRAINYNNAKNLIGCFYDPDMIFIDTHTLKTLDCRQYKSGICEALKISLITGGDLYKFAIQNAKKISNFNDEYIDLLQDFILKCIEAKLSIVKRDYFDLEGVRAVLNYGHTLGHVIESSLKFKDVPHGIGIAIGMDFSAYFNDNEDVFLQQRQVFTDLNIAEDINLCVKLLQGANINSFSKYFSTDKKKTSDNINFVFLNDIGNPINKSISIKNINEVLIKYICTFKNI